MFGNFIKNKRLDVNMSLRAFCKAIEEDPSNWSKIERGILGPPQNKEKLNLIAGVLKIKSGSAEWNEMNDFATVDAGNIPDYIKNDKDLLGELPAFFRTIGNAKPSKEELRKIIESIRKD